MSSIRETHVTVSLPYFRCRQFIRRAVESILGQSHTDLTLVVVNDGDDVPPWDLLSDIRDPRLVRFNLRANHGRYFADSVVLRAMHGRYLLIQDADDWSEPDRISVLMEILREDHADGALSAAYCHQLATSGRMIREKESFPRLHQPLGRKLAYRASHFGLYRADALRAIGGYYGGFRIGYDRLLVSLLLMTGKLAYIDEPLYNRFVRHESLSNSTATGMKSQLRKAVRQQLDELYRETYELYVEYLAGRFQTPELARHIRQICQRHVPQRDLTALAEEADRLRAMLPSANNVRPKRMPGASVSRPMHGTLPREVAAHTLVSPSQRPTISVVIPVRNDAARLPGTIQSIAGARTLPTPVEVVIVDDASRDDGCLRLVEQHPNLAKLGLGISVLRASKHVGIPRARNYGAAYARGDILFMTDAHVRFCENWDRYVQLNLRKNRILAATIMDDVTQHKGYGGSLVVPTMRMEWNTATPTELAPVQVASSAGMVLDTSLFHSIGGYDAGMVNYGSSEPEFSVRAWLCGMEILTLPQLSVAHRFRSEQDRQQLVERMLPFILHNRLRFGLLYLDDDDILRMLRYLALQYHERHVYQALDLVERSNIWHCKETLRLKQVLSFDWFLRRFNVTRDGSDAVDVSSLHGISTLAP